VEPKKVDHCFRLQLANLKLANGSFAVCASSR